MHIAARALSYEVTDSGFDSRWPPLPLRDTFNASHVLTWNPDFSRPFISRRRDRLKVKHTGHTKFHYQYTYRILLALILENNETTMMKS